MTDSDILRSATERLLEDESLTADLVDDAAKLLLNWGLEMVKRAVQQAEELPSEEIGARLAELRRTMKRINHDVGQAEPETQAEWVQALLYGPSIEKPDPEIQACGESFQDQQPSSRS
ncbi:MAG: hypothetical protein JW918_05275 [Anaerolineae bacterium]|nr:hypothetical protein [Anaerolineae bacterium]